MDPLNATHPRSRPCRTTPVPIMPTARSAEHEITSAPIDIEVPTELASHQPIALHRPPAARGGRPPAAGSHTRRCSPSAGRYGRHRVEPAGSRLTGDVSVPPRGFGLSSEASPSGRSTWPGNGGPPRQLPSTAPRTPVAAGRKDRLGRSRRGPGVRGLDGTVRVDTPADVNRSEYPDVHGVWCVGHPNSVG